MSFKYHLETSATSGTDGQAGLRFASVKFLVFVKLSGCEADPNNQTLLIELIHFDTLGCRDAAGERSAFRLSWLPAISLAPTSQPEFTKLLNASGVSKTNTTRNFMAPKPIPG